MATKKKTSTATLPAVSETVSPYVELTAGLQVPRHATTTAALVPFQKAAEEVEAQVERALITDAESFTRGSNLLSVISGNAKQVEDLRRATKKPLDDYAKLIQALFVPITNKLATAEARLKGKMTEWKRTEDARLRAAAEKLRKEQEEAALRMAQEAEAKGDTAGAEAILQVATEAPAALVPKTNVTNDFGQSTRDVTRWDGSVQSEKDILAAILDGALPMHIVDFRKVELNAIARNVRKEGIHHGIKITKLIDLQQR